MRRRWVEVSFWLGILCVSTLSSAAATVIYVDADAVGGANNGSSWADAYLSVSGALATAQYGDEIKVAQGKYKPATTGLANPREGTFQMVRGVALKGGYAGIGEPDPEARNIVAYETILSGDLADNDVIDSNPASLLNHPSRSDNCYVVVSSHNDDPNTILDGFTISGGNNIFFYGGGIIALDSNMVVSHCIIKNNSAKIGGGGIYDNSGCLLIEDDVFLANATSGSGGGIYNERGSPTIINCIFAGNRSEGPDETPKVGGGVHNFISAAVFYNCVFIGNRADGGGAMYNRSSQTTLINCTFSSNEASDAGGISNQVQSEIRLANCILWGDVPTEIFDGVDILGFPSQTVANNSIIQGGWEGEGNIDTDPRFIDADGFDNILGTLDDNLRLLAGSPGVDAGDNAALPDWVATDIDGNPRFVDDPETIDTGKGEPPIVDIGGYEGAYQGFVLDKYHIKVPEGRQAVFMVSLAADPAGVVEVTVAHTGGDTDIQVVSGGMLSFNSSNYAIPQRVILEALPDADREVGTADILISANGFFPLRVEAKEVELIFVDRDAVGGANNGISWANAYVSLQDALLEIWHKRYFMGNHDYGRGFEVRVAEGIYKPHQSSKPWPVPVSPQEMSFALQDEVAVRGGYAGWGQADPNTRDIKRYVTILSGDLEGDDGYNFTNYEENSWHVVTSFYCDDTTILDGFTCTGGNARGPAGSLQWYPQHNIGGGMYNHGSSPTVINCTFTKNLATVGGGIANYTEIFVLGWPHHSNMATYFYSHPTFVNCTFSDNRAYSSGGIYNAGSSCNLIQCEILNNVTDRSSSARGGGMYNVSAYISKDSFIYFIVYGHPVLTNCVISGNRGSYGGGLYHRGSSWPGSDGKTGGLTAVNCIFSGNESEYDGGGIGTITDNMEFVNCTFSNNVAGEYGGGLCYDSQDGPTIANCIFWDNRDIRGISEQTQISSSRRPPPWPPVPVGTVNINYSCIQGWTGDLGGIGNIGADPLFMDPNGLDNTAGTEDDNLRLKRGSPGIDAGDNTAVPAGIETDLDGDPRFADDPGATDSGNAGGKKGIVDMGAFEGVKKQFITSSGLIIVPEGQTAEFTVALYEDPQQTVEVSVVRRSGDPDISVVSGDTLYFNSSNYGTGQAVVLAAAIDNDDVNGEAEIWAQADGYVKAAVKAKEGDIDVPPVLYVDQDAPGVNNGTSWLDAFDVLQKALSYTSARRQVQEIRVAEGTHRPAKTGGNREVSFQLFDGVKIMGGYAGWGHTDPNTRDFKLYETFLSGDLHGDDGSNFTNNDENSYHVIIARDCAETAVLEGFTITGGNADGGREDNRGGGIYINNGAPKLVRCVFEQNRANWQGGGIYITESNSKIVGCTFSGNRASQGGGMHINGSSPTIINSVFSGNSAEEGGGGMCSYAKFSEENIIVNHPILINCTFSGNSSKNYYAGGIYSCESNTVLLNCILWGNTAKKYTIEDFQIYGWSYPEPAFTVNYSCIQGWTGQWGGSGNIDKDPCFLDAAQGDYHLQQVSPCIDAGCEAGVYEDMEGNVRPWDYPGVDNNGALPEFDMGAYEFVNKKPIADAG
ncbi:MAG: hypothetical protein AMJ79_14995, partial [Phycisphaerae bacterium SM23_30]